MAKKRLQKKRSSSTVRKQESEILQVTTSKTEPVRVETSKVEPVKVETSKVEPVKVETSKVEPVKVETSKVEPVKLDVPVDLTLYNEQSPLLMLRLNSNVSASKTSTHLPAKFATYNSRLAA